MKFNDVFTLLKTFTKEDLKKMHKFLSSPYYNTNEKIIKLYKELIRFYPGFTGTKLSKERIYKRIYNKGVYNDSTMRNLLFRLEQLIYSYLTIENFSHNSFTKDNHLLNELNNRLLKDSFAKVSTKMNLKFPDSVGTDYNYFHNKYMHESAKYNYISLHQKRTKKVIITTELETLNKANIYLTIFFITEIICNYLIASVYNEKYKNSGKTNFIDSLVKTLDVKKIFKLTGGKAEHDYILQIYADLLECFVQTGNNQSYYNYRNSVHKYAAKLSPDEMSFHYSKLINYCIMRQNLNEKDEEFKSELFNIYNAFLRRKYYKNNKTQYFPQNLFRSILFLGLSQKEFTWCKNFLDKYGAEVEPHHRENMINFGYCFYYFRTAQYNKALEYSKLVSNEYFIFKHDINRISLQINIILHNTEEINRIIHKYKEALRKDEYLSDTVKKAHQNFVTYAHKLTKAYENSNKVEAGLIRQKLLESKNVLQKEWLLKEYDTMLGKKLG